jgi:uncharacterized protein (TIGR03086 family)
MSFGDNHGLPRMETRVETDIPDLGPVCREVTRLLGEVGDERLGGPTPCPEYAVRDILAHLLGLTVAFRDAARKDLGPTTATPPDGAGLPALTSDWREALPRQLGEMADAWRSPAAWDGPTRVGGVDLPGGVVGLIGLNEVLVHGWDLARSTGLPYAPDEASLQASHGLLAPATGSEDGATSAENLFGPRFEVPADAPLLDRVIGLNGRDPGWRPTG